MIISIVFFLLITLSGTLLTYLYDTKDSLFFRLSAGNVVGSAAFGTLAFLLACFFGLSPVTLLIALAIVLASFGLLTRSDLRERFQSDIGAAKKSLNGFDAGKGLTIAYYVGIALLLYFFFGRAMIETRDGIFTGASQNLGDLPFHLGAIFSFTEGNNFPPENPSFANAKFTYPFIADFLTACAVKFGSGVSSAMLVQNVTLGFSLCVIFEKFIAKITGNRLAGKFGTMVLLFCGGLGFVIFFRDLASDGRGIFEYLWNISADYTIRPKGIRWGNSLTTLFITQRSLLLGMPVTIIVLTWIWELFNTRNAFAESQSSDGDGLNTNEQKGTGPAETSPSPLLPFSTTAVSAGAVGVLAGTLPLIHVHSLIVLFVVCAFLLVFSLNRWREWLMFGVATAAIAVPEMIWVMTGSATRLSEFVGWHFGWVAENENIVFFWAKNLGLFLPLLACGLVLLFYRNDDDETSAGKVQPDPVTFVLFYIPFVFLFVICNLFKLAPWEWDNIKVLIYWFVASIPLVGWVLARLWEQKIFFKIACAACLFVLILSGALDVWRVISGQINYKVFDKDAVAIAEQIREKTPPRAMFLNAPTYNSAVVLSGRRSLMRYSGHLSSYGIDYIPREDEVKRIYEGTALADSFLRKEGIEYVIISPEENDLTVDEAFFEKFPKIAQVGQYRIYKITK